MMNVERVTTGSARRRRERRLRSLLRHERMSVAMALAERRSGLRSWRNSWWKCRSGRRRRRRRSWHLPGMPLVARGSTSVDHVGPTGGCRVRAMSSGAHQKGSPPARGGIHIVGTGDVTTSSSSCRSTVDGASLQFHRQSCGYSRYATETGTHSAKLCIFGLVLDMPVVVHVKVVDNTVVAQRSFLPWSCSADH